MFNRPRPSSQADNVASDERHAASSISALKQDLRAELRARRRVIPAARRAAAASMLADEVERRWPEHLLMAYVAHGHELSTAALLAARWGRGQVVYLPRVEGSQLHWFPVAGEDGLIAGYRGISEPGADPAAASLPNAPWVIVVPGLGFSERGLRLGQGGGFYDRALSDLRQSSPKQGVVIGVAFVEQRQDTIPCEAHDVTMDEVLFC